MRNVSDKAVEKITTQISGSETIFLFFESPTVYEIMWENKMHPYRPQVTIRRMNFGSWIPKATDTLWEYVILIAFPLQELVYERASMFVIHKVPLFYVNYSDILANLISEEELNFWKGNFDSLFV